jgi:hypothetical protein
MIVFARMRNIGYNIRKKRHFGKGRMAKPTMPNMNIIFYVLH